MGGTHFRHVVLIGGNDDRGIDVALMSREGFAIDRLRSHAGRREQSGQPVFSRDCPEYTVTTQGGQALLILVNHFKSKGYGSPASSNARRRTQAQRLKKIYEARLAAGASLIAVIGSLNDTPASRPLEPLVQGTTVRDAFTRSGLDNGGFPGTFGPCNAGKKIDYLLLSPELFSKAQVGGTFRRGMWPGSRPKRWETYPELTRQVEAASDHAAVRVGLDL